MPKFLAFCTRKAGFAAWMILAVCLCGCSTTLHEKKASEADSGTLTQLKLTGPRVKLQHEF